MNNRIDVETAREVEEFLFDEAALLDDGHFDEWLALFAPDIRYFVPVRTTRSARERDKEFSGTAELAHFDDDYEGLKTRIRRLATGFAWAEDPPSRTRHFVSNIRLRALENDEFEVTSNTLVYRSRLERQVDMFSGKRVDRLRRSGGGRKFEIAARTVYLDHTLILTNSISIFF